jgi:hypothetical protein
MISVRREKIDAKKKYRPGDIPDGRYLRQLLLLVLLIFVCAGISCWWGFCASTQFTAMLNSPGMRSIKMLQFQRLNWMHAALWTVVFAVSLAIIFKSFTGSRFLVLALITAQLLIAIFALRAEHSEQQLTIAEFYSPSLFTEIRDFIGKPQADYRVASLGIYPSIALYNGFYSADGYWVNYPLTYKHRFRRAIADELAKDPDLADYFDNWGSRCYLFSAELGRTYLYTKDSGKRRIDRLSIDTVALADLDVQYILSAVEIGNADELNLKLQRSFEHGDSPWKIYLYSLQQHSALPQRGQPSGHNDRDR